MLPPSLTHMHIHTLTLLEHIHAHKKLHVLSENVPVEVQAAHSPTAEDFSRFTELSLRSTAPTHSHTHTHSLPLCAASGAELHTARLQFHISVSTDSLTN